MIDKVVHIPVLLDEVTNALCLTEDEVYVDATFGLGGYTQAILSKNNCTFIRQTIHFLSESILICFIFHRKGPKMSILNF